MKHQEGFFKGVRDANIYFQSWLPEARHGVGAGGGPLEELGLSRRGRMRAGKNRPAEGTSLNTLNDLSLK